MLSNTEAGLKKRYLWKKREYVKVFTKLLHGQKVANQVQFFWNLFLFTSTFILYVF